MVCCPDNRGQMVHRRSRRISSTLTLPGVHQDVLDLVQAHQYRHHHYNPLLRPLRIHHRLEDILAHHIKSPDGLDCQI